MKNIISKLHNLLFLTLLTFLFSKTGASSSLKVLYIKQIANPTSIEIETTPHETTFSLGDEINFDGLKIKVNGVDEEQIIETGFSLSEVDNLALGEQTIIVTYNNLVASFKVRFTNLNAVTQPLVATNLFINEISYQPTALYLSLYNGTGMAISLDNYKLRLSKQDEHLDLALPHTQIEHNQTYKVSNVNSIAGLTINLFDDTWHMDDVQEVALMDGATSSSLDTILFDVTSPIEVINGLVDIDNFHLKRDWKQIYPEMVFNPTSWRIAPLTLFGSHTLAPVSLTFEQQAVSYAEYMMYGIGMNAAHDYVNIFYHLREEWSLMDPESKAYLLNNKNYKISGINEEGRQVTNSFSDAIARYNYLAGKTGNPGLTSANSLLRFNLSNVETILIFSLLLIVAGGGYFLIRRGNFRFLK